MTEIIGIDHIYIAVSDLDTSEAFYEKFMPKLGFRKNAFTLKEAPHIQYYNRHFGFVLRPAEEKGISDGGLSPGLHHFCFRVTDDADVDAVARILQDAGIRCSNPRRYPEYAPDYYAVYFTDPDGIRLEVTNYREERRKRFAEWNRSATTTKHIPPGTR